MNCPAGCPHHNPAPPPPHLPEGEPGSGRPICSPPHPLSPSLPASLLLTSASWWPPVPLWAVSPHPCDEAMVQSNCQHCCCRPPPRAFPLTASCCQWGRIVAPPVPAASQGASEVMGERPPTTFLNSYTHSEPLPQACHFSRIISFHPHITGCQSCHHLPFTEEQNETCKGRDVPKVTEQGLGAILGYCLRGPVWLPQHHSVLYSPGSPA